MTPAATQEQVASILRARRARLQAFGCELFSDPAWDIMLELLSAKLQGRRVKLADIKGIAPKSTVARWVAALEERRLIRFEMDPCNPTNPWVELAPATAAKLEDLLGQVGH